MIFTWKYFLLINTAVRCPEEVRTLKKLWVSACRDIWCILTNLHNITKSTENLDKKESSQANEILWRSAPISKQNQFVSNPKSSAMLGHFFSSVTNISVKWNTIMHPNIIKTFSFLFFFKRKTTYKLAPLPLPWGGEWFSQSQHRVWPRLSHNDFFTNLSKQRNFWWHRPSKQVVIICSQLLPTHPVRDTVWTSCSGHSTTCQRARLSKPTEQVGMLILCIT